MQQKGQVSANLALGATAQTAGVEISTAVAVSNKIAVMGNFNGSGSASGDRINLGEFGGGYFKRIGNHGSFETYAGWGGGRILTPTGTLYSKNSSGNDTTVFVNGIKINYNRAFLQATIGYSNSYVDFAGGFRYCYLNYNHGFNPYNDQFPNIDSRGVHLLEPTVLFRFGYRAFKFSIQYTTTLDLSKSNLIYHSGLINIAFGMHLNFNSKKHPPTNYLQDL